MQNYNVVTIANQYPDKWKQGNGVDYAGGGGGGGGVFREGLMWVTDSSEITGGRTLVPS